MIAYKMFPAILFSILYLNHSYAFLSDGFGYSFLEKQLQESKASSQTSKVTTNWIKQPIDHFGNSDLGSWEMRFFERLDLWKPDGPVYIFIGGEGTANPLFLTGGLIYALANETNGALFMSEHRYYGQSFPYDPKSKDYLKKLKYLSSSQALADLAVLIKNIKSKPQFINAKVVLVGGSYPGNLAAWMKLKYPHLVDAAVASSAPVLAKLDFYEYLETVTDDFEQYGGNGCYDFIQKTFERYSELLKTDLGIEQLKIEEHICNETDMTKPENQHFFIQSKAVYFMVVAQYYSVQGIEKACRNIQSQQRVSYFWEKDTFAFNLLKLKSSENCNDFDFSIVVRFIREYRTLFTSWLWQTCTEFSYAKSTSSKHQIFTSLMPIETFFKLCQESYGEEYNESFVEKSVNETNALFGGLTPKVEHVIFVNGETDPWHRLGILEDVSYDAPALMIPRSSHCRDLGSDYSSDPEELRETRKDIKYWIKSWLGLDIKDRI